MHWHNFFSCLRFRAEHKHMISSHSSLAAWHSATALRCQSTNCLDLSHGIDSSIAAHLDPVLNGLHQRCYTAKHAKAQPGITLHVLEPPILARRHCACGTTTCRCCLCGLGRRSTPEEARGSCKGAGHLTCWVGVAANSLIPASAFVAQRACELPCPQSDDLPCPTSRSLFEFD